MTNLNPETVAAFIGIYLTILGSVWGLGRYFDGRFTKVFEKIDTVRDQIMNKLEYHEKHDDKRFSEIREDLWETRLRMAIKPAPRKKNAREEDAA
jgi:hypothetical protein